MGMNPRLIVPIVYALAVVIALMIDRTVGAVVVVVGGILVGAFFVFFTRARRGADH